MFNPPSDNKDLSFSLQFKKNKNINQIRKLKTEKVACLKLQKGKESDNNPVLVHHYNDRSIYCSRFKGFSSGKLCIIFRSNMVNFCSLLIALYFHLKPRSVTRESSGWKAPHPSLNVTGPWRTQLHVDLGTVGEFNAPSRQCWLLMSCQSFIGLDFFLLPMTHGWNWRCYFQEWRGFFLSPFCQACDVLTPQQDRGWCIQTQQGCC